jgi:hypothetical protein
MCVCVCFSITSWMWHRGSHNFLFSQSYITTDCQSARLPCVRPPSGTRNQFIFLLSLIILRQLRVCWRGAPSLTRSRVCSISVVAGPRQRSLSRVWVPRDSWAYFIVLIFETPPNLESHVPVFISRRNRVAQLYLQALGLPNSFTYYYMIHVTFCIRTVYIYTYKASFSLCLIQ